MHENPQIMIPCEGMIYWSRFFSTAIYQQPFSQFILSFFLLFTGLNCFHSQMRTDRGGVCEIVLEFCSLILADVYRPSVDK